jgi:hypothetical protein
LRQGGARGAACSVLRQLTGWDWVGLGSRYENVSMDRLLRDIRDGWVSLACVNFVGAQRLALVGGQAVGRPWGRRGRAEGHVTQRQPATGSLRTMPQQNSADAAPKAATAGEMDTGMDMDRAAKTAKTSSAALLLLCAPPLGAAG